jgi:hypothetical protein
MNDQIREKQAEIIEKKGQIISHLLKIILRNTRNITLRTWERDYIHKYPETSSKLESELSALIEAENSEEKNENMKHYKCPDIKQVTDEDIEKAAEKLQYDNIYGKNGWICGAKAMRDGEIPSSNTSEAEKEKKSPEEILKQVFQIDKLPKHRLILSANEIMELMLIYAEQ